MSSYSFSYSRCRDVQLTKIEILSDIFGNEDQIIQNMSFNFSIGTSFAYRPGLSFTQRKTNYI